MLWICCKGNKSQRTHALYTYISISPSTSINRHDCTSVVMSEWSTGERRREFSHLSPRWTPPDCPGSEQTSGVIDGFQDDKNWWLFRTLMLFLQDCCYLRWGIIMNVWAKSCSWAALPSRMEALEGLQGLNSMGDAKQYISIPVDQCWLHIYH